MKIVILYLGIVTGKSETLNDSSPFFYLKSEIKLKIKNLKLDIKLLKSYKIIKYYYFYKKLKKTFRNFVMKEKECARCCKRIKNLV